MSINANPKPNANNWGWGALVAPANGAAAIDLSADLSAESILAMHEALMRPHDPDIAGRWRTEQVWIGGGRLGPHYALFVPPQHT